MNFRVLYVIFIIFLAKWSLFEYFLLKRSCAPISSLIWKNVCNCTLKWQWKPKICRQHVNVVVFRWSYHLFLLWNYVITPFGEADPIYYHISSMGFLEGISFFSSEFWPPKKLFVCSDGNFQISLSGSPLFDCRVRMIGRPKAPADHPSFMQQFFFKILSFYICLPIRWTVINMKLNFNNFEVM